MRTLVTGATGVVGTEVVDRLRADPSCPGPLTRVARRASDAELTAWDIGSEPPPRELSGHWDVIVHTAASTRWTMSRAEALAANVEPLRAVLALADGDTHVVHVSTAYVGGSRASADLRGADFDGYRNGYEWSKAACESLVREEHGGPLTIVRPPLIVGRRDNGRIARFSGPYTIIHALVSGLAAVVVGDPDGYAEISPVDDVAEAVAAAALAPPPASPRVEVVAGGGGSLRLSAMIGITCRTLNEVRARHGVAPVDQPPFVPTETWNRFYLPLAERYLSPFQHHAVRLLAMFQSYTSMSSPFEPTRTVRDPAAVMETAVRHWASRRPRLALAAPNPWTLLTS
ncbi:SDR family oxidoreductase [Actinacidiphila yeochonensis]|uniref:SDR family oxidoreductase n=1 Tax=Actinacidiphila yeochonensis TaxID=89050 RepID=UPI000566B8B8|nr:SDR family oxidoreductase [Actinacidiphila yeochonensis]